MPYTWVPDLVKECTFIMCLRYHESLGKTAYEAYFDQEISFAIINKYRFGMIIAYSNVESSSHFNESRVNYGVIVGRDISGNLLVESLATKLRDRVAIVNAIIPVDQKIINYFQQYDKVRGLRYSRAKPLLINKMNITDS